MITPLSRLGGTDIAEAINRGATICVATQRLARALHHAWTDLMMEEGRSVWRTPDILPLGAWQHRMVAVMNVRLPENQTAPLHILEQQQELLTWEQAAIVAGVFNDALQPLQLAAAMMDAHALALAWDLRIDATDVPPGTDAAAFLAVREQAELRWRQLGAVPAAFMPWRAMEAARIFPQLLPKEIVFIGFDLPPDAALRETYILLRNSGVHITQVTSRNIPAGGLLLKFPTFEDELHDAAQWCGSLLERGEGEIGIIIPHLDSVRVLTQRIFTDVLQPSAAIQEHDGAAALFELSLGPRAIEEPLIDAAFLLLELQRNSIPVERWTRILHSPFIVGNGSWGDQRARLDAELHRGGLREAGSSDVRRVAALLDGASGDPFLAALAKLSFENVRRTAEEWTVAFIQVLDLCGWPGDRGMNSREYQARERFRDLLQEFAGLDAVMAPIPLVEALGRFHRLAAERVFQVKSANAPVQIMGTRESAGLRFAHCRVLGMNDNIWPPSPRTAAFIPMRLQRIAGVTAAIPECYLAQVREETALLFRAADEVTFTCSGMDGDRELLPSPMVASLEMENREARRRDAVHFIAGHERTSLQQLRDSQAPMVEADEGIRGGTSVISLQSACPFRAFAEKRLHATGPDRAEHGVSAIDRGNLIHVAMELFWKEVANQKQLMALSDSELRQLLDSCIGNAIQEQKALYLRRVSDHVIDAERECLSLLLAEWIQIEKTRSPFTVNKCEEWSEIDIAGLHLSVRADRIDLLPDGSELLIDYKTGIKTVAAWMSPRPKDPQIPLYLQTINTNFRAAAFALLRRGESRLAGLRDDDVPIEELQAASEYLKKRESEETDWQSLRISWTSILEGLATEFLSGHAEVQPRDGAESCKWCKLSAFCRIDSADREDAGDGDE